LFAVCLVPHTFVEERGFAINVCAANVSQAK